MYFLIRTISITSTFTLTKATKIKYLIYLKSSSFGFNWLLKLMSL